MLSLLLKPGTHLSKPFALLLQKLHTDLACVSCIWCLYRLSVGMHTCGAQSRIWNFPPPHSLPTILRQGILNWKLVTSDRRDGQLAMEIDLSPCPLGKVM